MRTPCTTLALLLLLLLAGCDSGGEDAPKLQGRFEGTFAYSVLDAMFEEPWVVDLTENARGEVSGNGDLGDDPVTAAGTHDHPDVTLSFQDRFGAAFGVFTGTLSEDGTVLQGVFNFSILFVNNPVTLRRQAVRMTLRRQ